MNILLGILGISMVVLISTVQVYAVEMSGNTTGNNTTANKSEISNDAELRLRYQYDRAIGGDKDNNTDLNTIKSRFKFNSTFRSGEKYMAHVTLMHNAIWGDVMAGNSSSTVPDGTGFTNPSTGVTTTNSANTIMVNEVYGVWMINEAWSLKFGRGGFTLADGSLIGRNEWQSTPNSFDGALINWEQELFRLNIFGVKVADNAQYLGGNINTDPETNFYGLAADIKALPEFIKMANVHVMNIHGEELPGVSGDKGKGKTSFRYGAVIGGETHNVDYKIVYENHNGKDRQSGASVDTKGYMYQLDGGYTLPDFMKSRLSVAYHYDTGDTNSTGTSEGYDALYYERHGASGLMDVLAWGNLNFWKVAYTFQPSDQLEFGVYYWLFKNSSGEKPPTANNNGNEIRKITDDTVLYRDGFIDKGNSDVSRDLGQELDLTMTKKYDGGLSMSLIAGAFMPGAYFKNDNSNFSNNGHKDTYYQLLFEGKMTF